MRRFVVSFLTLAVLFAPQSVHASDNSFWGTTMGGALGGWVGSTMGKGSGKLATTGAGVFLGSMIGNNIGRSMDRPRTLYATPRSYNHGSYTPSFNSYTPTYVAPPAPPPPRVIYVRPQIVEYKHVTQPTYVEGGYVGGPPVQKRGQRRGRHCREFTQTIKIDGQVHESYGTACLRPDGSWQIVP